MSGRRIGRREGQRGEEHGSGGAARSGIATRAAAATSRIAAFVAAAGLALVTSLMLPASAHGQFRGVVGFEFGNAARGGGRWSHGYVTQRIPRVGMVYYQPVRYQRVRGVRIPRRFRPARGMCRLWYPGLANRRQPGAVRCDALQGRFHRDVMVVTWRGVLRPVLLNDRFAFYRNAHVRGARVRNGRVAARVVAPGYRPYAGARGADRFGWNHRYGGNDRGEWYGHRWNGDDWIEDWWDDSRRGDRWDDDRWDDDRWDDDDRDDRRRDRDGRRRGDRVPDRRGIR